VPEKGTSLQQATVDNTFHYALLWDFADALVDIFQAIFI
jgi:hypothetical protein